MGVDGGMEHGGGCGQRQDNNIAASVRPRAWWGTLQVLGAWLAVFFPASETVVVVVGRV